MYFIIITYFDSVFSITAYFITIILLLILLLSLLLLFLRIRIVEKSVNDLLTQPRQEIAFVPFPSKK